MTITEANKIFKSKYQNGEIYAKGGDYSKNKTSIQIIFNTKTEKPKIYSYNVGNYVELLQKVGFEIIYQKDIENIKKELARLQEELSLEGAENDYFGDIITYTKEQKEYYKTKIEECQEKLQKIKEGKIIVVKK